MDKNWMEKAIFRLKWFLTPEYGREELLRKERAAGPKITGNTNPQVKEKKPRVILGAKSDIRISNGHLDVPEGTDEIWNCALEGREELKSVFVPASVKRIDDGAFSDCVNLERVVLSEGLLSMGRNVFAGCSRLRSIVIPNSVKELPGWAFYRSGIAEPVLNAAGDTLYFCPAQAAGKEYAVPHGIRRIGANAFLELKELEKVTLPETLESIGIMAFLNCGLTEVTVPAGVREIGSSAFRGCRNLKTIHLTGEKDPVRAAVTLAYIRGQSFMKPCRPLPREGDKYWKEAAFRALARKCETGSAAAMEEMAAFFEAKQREDPEIGFYGPAANFWRFRAWERGSEKAGAWLESWLQEPENGPLPSPFLSEKLSGTVPGRCLNALGFLFFDPDREYHLDGRDSDGVVEVSSYESEDGPDEDGFGREIYYDWWYLDENLCPVPGVDCLHSYSNTDRRANERRFSACHDAAARAIAMRAPRSGR